MNDKLPTVYDNINELKSALKKAIKDGNMEEAKLIQYALESKSPQNNKGVEK